MASRRAVAAYLISKQLPIRSSERRMRKGLRPLFEAYLKTLRKSSKRLPDDRLLPNFRRTTRALRDSVLPVVRRGSVYEAEHSYADTLKELRKLGERVAGTISDAQRKEVLKEIDKLTRKRLDPLPERMLNRVSDLRSDKNLRPLAQGLADGLAREAATLARTETERIANEQHGTGWWYWITVGDHRVRRSHKSINRQRRRIGSQFSNGVRYPRDPLGPAHETFNCRCHTRPARAPR